MGSTPIGQMINPTGSQYYWNDFLFSPDDSLMVMLGASGNGQTIDVTNPRPTHGGYLLDMLRNGNPGHLEPFYGSGGYGVTVQACADLLPLRGIIAPSTCQAMNGTVAGQHPNDVRITYTVNPSAPAFVPHDAAGLAEFYLIPPP